MTAIDSHHHFWDPSRADYPWMTDEVAPIRRAFGPADLRPLVAAQAINRTILVQTRSSTDETREFLATAVAEPFIGGVIGWVDLTDPAVADEIAGLRAGSGGERLVGIRHQVHDEPDPAWLNRPEVRRGLQAVADAGLAYDLLVRTRELPAALAAGQALPDIRFVVDHLAKPRIAEAEMEPWAGRLRALAALPNVWCKVSGMVTEADWSSWSVGDLRPYVDVVLEAFGPGRLLFGSDWPVCLLAASYDRVVDVSRELLDDLSEGEQARVFGGTALEVYRLGAD
jgi:L-fuconolactonase